MAKIPSQKKCGADGGRLRLSQTERIIKAQRRNISNEERNESLSMEEEARCAPQTMNDKIYIAKKVYGRRRRRGRRERET